MSKDDQALHAEGERIFFALAERLNLDPNDGDVDSGDAVDWITAMLAAGESEVIADIRAERARQDAQWGGPAHDDEHEPIEWLGFITEQAYTNVGVDVRGRLIKIAALAIAGIDSLDRKAEKEQG